MTADQVAFLKGKTTFLLTNSKGMTKFVKAMAKLDCTVEVGENLHATVENKFFYLASGILDRRNIRTYGTAE